MKTVSDFDAGKWFGWLREKGLQFKLGRDEETELTESQVLQQCKMYIAAVRLATNSDARPLESSINRD